MTDKHIIKPRPICLYEDTCLHLKEKTRLCEDCVHHKNYWSELLEKEQVEKIKSLEQECEEVKKELQAQRALTAHEQKLIYCVAYDETCKTGNDCKQEKCIFKDNIKLKQTLAEIKEIAEQISLPMGTGKSCNRVILAKQILQKISEVENERTDKKYNN